MTAQIIYLASRKTLRTRAYLPPAIPAPHVPPAAMPLAALVWWSAWLLWVAGALNGEPRRED